jgi:hypothetical protein
VNNDDLQLLADFRSEVPTADEATAERIYRLATTPRPARRRPFALHVPRQPRSVVAATAEAPVAALRKPRSARRRRLIGISAAAALSLAGTLVALSLSAPPPSAYAAAKKAIAATSTAALDSGTMTLQRTAADGSTVTVATVRWNGDDIAIASGADGVIPRFDQLLLVAGDVYLQPADGTWLHFSSEAELGSPLDAGTVQAARGFAAGSRSAQIIASAYSLQKTVQPDGSTVYSGTIPPITRAEVTPSDDTATQLMLPSFGSGGAFQLVVGSDGLVRQVSETASPPATGAWSVEYSKLGDTPQITPPATYTEVTPADLPAPPQGH